MKKIILTAAIVVIAAGVALFWWGYSNLDGLVKDAIERHGSEAAGTPVRVATVQLSLSLDQGKGVIQGLTLANPEGFPAGIALSFGTIEVEIEPASIASNPIIVQAVRLLDPQVNYIVNEAGKSNFDVIRQNLQKSPRAGAGGSSSPERRLLIREFVLGAGKVRADIAALGSEPLEIRLPEAAERNLGAPDGVLPEELARDLVNRISRRVLASTAQSEIEKLIDQKLGGEAGKAVKDILKSVIRP